MHFKNVLTTFFAILVCSILFTGCGEKRTTLIAQESEGPHPFESRLCSTCHPGLNLVALHDATSPKYDGDCVKCHGEMISSEHPAHNVMIPKVADVKDGVQSSECLHCHPTVDILGGSAGNLRKQVKTAEKCSTCHQPNGESDEVFYQATGSY